MSRLQTSRISLAPRAEYQPKFLFRESLSLGPQDRGLVSATHDPPTHELRLNFSLISNFMVDILFSISNRAFKPSSYSFTAASSIFFLFSLCALAFIKLFSSCSTLSFSVVTNSLLWKINELILLSSSCRSFSAVRFALDYPMNLYKRVSKIYLLFDESISTSYSRVASSSLFLKTYCSALRLIFGSLGGQVNYYKAWYCGMSI